ncbi:hypothetical protein GCM10009075_42740 [Sphingomonas trueperi]
MDMRSPNESFSRYSIRHVLHLRDDLDDDARPPATPSTAPCNEGGLTRRAKRHRLLYFIHSEYNFSCSAEERDSRALQHRVPGLAKTVVPSRHAGTGIAARSSPNSKEKP